MSLANEMRREMIDILLELEKSIENDHPNSYVYEQCLLLNEENVNKTILENNLQLKANGFNKISSILEELKKYKLNQGYNLYSAKTIGKTCKVYKFRYGDYCRVNIEKKIALTDEELFIYFCMYPKTYKKRIALANSLEKECQEKKNYFNFLELINFSALNKVERDIVKEYKEKMKENNSFSD